MFACFTPATAGTPGAKGTKWLLSGTIVFELSKEKSVAQQHSDFCDQRERILTGFHNFALSSENVLTRKVKEVAFENGNGLAYIDKECSVFQGGMTTVLVRRGGVGVGVDRNCRTDTNSVVGLAAALGRGLVSPDTLDRQQNALVEGDEDAAKGGFAAIVYDSAHSAVLVMRDSEGAAPLFYNSTEDGQLCFCTSSGPLRFTVRDEDGRRIYKEPKAFPPGHFFAAGAGAETYNGELRSYSAQTVKVGRPVTPEGKMWLAGMPMRKYKGRAVLQGDESQLEPEAQEARAGKFGKHARVVASTKALCNSTSWRSVNAPRERTMSIGGVVLTAMAAVRLTSPVQ